MKSKRKIITLLTDFGSRDSYVAEMKAIILSIYPEATLIDITHEVVETNVVQGAYILARSVGFFPKGSIHLAVVDPGVGGVRRPIVIEATSAVLIGPDNGLLASAAERLGLKHIYLIENKKYIPSRVSETFHGRDIFAPIAAYIASGILPAEFGREIFDITQSPIPKSKLLGKKIGGEIIYVDKFGNLVTNIESKLLHTLGVKCGETLKLRVGRGKQIKVKLVKSYSDVSSGGLLLIPGSGYSIEISVNLGSAAEILTAGIGIEIELTTPRVKTGLS